MSDGKEEDGTCENSASNSILGKDSLNQTAAKCYQMDDEIRNEYVRRVKVKGSNRERGCNN